MRNVLIYFAMKYEGDCMKIAEAIRKKEFVPTSEIERIKTMNLSAVTLLDPEFPSCLKICMPPPFVLFYRGDLRLLREGIRLCVVGARETSSYGIAATEKVLEELFSKREVTVVSGMARGIDTAAHRIALKHRQKTIAVLGSGLEKCYPEMNRHLMEEIAEKGLLITEYPPLTTAKASHFPMRNRIVSALSKAVLVTEAYERSGTMITVRFALEQGKEILAIPHPITRKSFCNVLIQQGAVPVLSGEDIEEIIF